MTNNTKDALDSLIDGVEYVVKSQIKNAPFDKVKNGKILAQNSDGTYKVLLEKNTYNIEPLGNQDMPIGSIVKVLIPQNNYSHMFILNGGSGGSSESSYNDLSDKPQINGHTLVGNQSSADLGITGEENVIDTIKVNGTTQTVTNKAVDITVPTQTSQLTNNSGFITNTVNNLTNYELKADVGHSIVMSLNSSTYVLTISLKNSAGTILNTQTVDFPLETMVVNGEYDSTTKEIILTLDNGNTIRFSVADLVSGLQSEITNDNKLASDLVDDTNQLNKFVTATEKTTWNAKYDKPANGIPKTDLDSAVQTSLGKADTSVQPADIANMEVTTNKVTNITDENTNIQYPSAKAVNNRLITRVTSDTYINDSSDVDAHVNYIEADDISQDTTKLTYTCVGTETGDYYFVYSSTNYQFTMPTISAGSVLVFDTTSLKLYLGTDEITTTTASTGTLITLSGTPNPDYPQAVKTFSGNVSVVVQNKNYVSSTKKQGDILYLNTARSYTDYIFKPGTYTLSFTTDKSTTVYTKTASTNSTSIGSGSPKTITMTEDFNIWIYRSRLTADDISNVMLEKNNSATTYIAHQAQTYPLTIPASIYLGNIGTAKNLIFKNEVGSPYYNSTLTEGKWYWLQNVGKITLNGTEDWQLKNTSQNGTKTYSLSNAPSNYFRESSTSGGGYAFCDKFKVNRTVQALATMYNELLDVIGISFYYNSTNISRYMYINTTEDLPTYLTTNNAVLYYKLETPTYTEITDTTLLGQLEALYQFRTYKNVTNITITGGNINGTLNYTYVKDYGFGRYTKPEGGIPKTDLDASVQASLDKADTSVQPVDITNMEVTTNKVTSITSSSTDTGYPSAKAVYDFANEPLMSKTYTGVQGSGDNNSANYAFYYMSIVPDSYTESWSVRYRIRVWIPGQTNFEAVSDSFLTGDQGSTNAYAFFNRFYSTSYRPVYYQAMYRLTQDGFNGGYGHAVGMNMTDSNERATSGYARSFTVEILAFQGCTVTLLDTPVLWANWEGTGDTNYGTISNYNFSANGLQETGDANDNSIAYVIKSYYDRTKVGANKLFKYNLCTYTDGDKIEGFVNSSSTGTTKTKNTSTFRIGAPIYYYNSGTNLVANDIPADLTLVSQNSTVDLRYSTNCGSTLTVNLPVYLVGIPSGSTFTLADTWYSQTLPSTADGKIYILLGVAFDVYKVAFNIQHPVYEYKNGAVQLYNAPVTSSDVTSALGYTPVNKAGDTMSGNLTPDVTNTTDLGSSSTVWANVYATTFHGALDGNAATATKATQDGGGNNISDTYVHKAGDTMTGTLIISHTTANQLTLQNSTKSASMHYDATDDCIEFIFN